MHAILARFSYKFFCDFSIFLRFFSGTTYVNDSIAILRISRHSFTVFCYIPFWSLRPRAQSGVTVKTETQSSSFSINFERVLLNWDMLTVDSCGKCTTNVDVFGRIWDIVRPCEIFASTILEPSSLAVLTTDTANCGTLKLVCNWWMVVVCKQLDIVVGLL